MAGDVVNNGFAVVMAGEAVDVVDNGFADGDDPVVMKRAKVC